MYEINESGPCPPGNNFFSLEDWLRGKRKMIEIDLSGLFEGSLCSKTEKAKDDRSKQLLFNLLILLSC